MASENLSMQSSGWRFSLDVGGVALRVDLGLRLKNGQQSMLPKLCMFL